MHPRRALLYMPGDDMRKIQKAATLGVDCICMDMEDGVAVNRKDEARSTIAQALQSVDFGNAEKLARINPIGSGLEADDLKLVLPFRPDGIVVPKVETPEQVHQVETVISAVELAQGWEHNSLALIVLIETALGVVNLREIASSTRRLQALIFGSEDLAADIGAERTDDGWEIFFARSAVVTHAAAFGLQAIDMVHIDFQDDEGLRLEAIQGAQMGYSGKQIIHPNQVRIVHEAFSPNSEAVAQARRIVDAFQKHQLSGTGAFALDGKMIDAPIVKAAERLLARAGL